MAIPLLTTKLYIRPPRPDVLSRPRLIRRLAEGLRLGRRLTLISAPAGYAQDHAAQRLAEQAKPRGGESTSRRRGNEPSVSWLSLEEEDSDPVRFWTYLVAALQQVEPDLGQRLVDAFRSPQRPSIQPLLTPLINQIASYPGHLIVVLDDYHLVASEAVQTGVRFLLNHLPGNAHLVIATRADPPLPLARLRGRGQLTELRQADLRLTPAEVAAFLQRVAGLDLPAKEIAALEERTEGWITGLQLAALSMRGRDDVSGFASAFTGSHRYVLDYMIVPADSPFLGDIAAIRAYAASQRGDVGRTVALAERALERLPASKLGERAVVFLVLGSAHLFRGDVSAAADAFGEAADVGQQGGNLHLALPALNSLATIQVSQGELRSARATAQEAGLVTGPDGHTLPIGAGAVSALAELAYERNRLEEALARALNALAEALTLAEPEGYLRSFVDRGPALVPLLQEAAAHGIAPDYANDLLSAFDGTDEVSRAPRKQPLIEPLSARELEVLSLVAEGLSNREVGRRLHIAESTVKSHLNNVYGKLAVDNRTQAAAKARALNLL
jgi:ATP/maltotriose-dependent transcriptional regulator MalT